MMIGVYDKNYKREDYVADIIQFSDYSKFST